VRVYTKRRGEPPDFSDPVVLTRARGGYNVESCCRQIHVDMIRDYNFGYGACGEGLSIHVRACVFMRVDSVGF
jgi:ribosome-interacting GTPase 1